MSGFTRWFKRYTYRLARSLVRLLARPTITGVENLPDNREVVYVLQQRSLSDLIVLDLLCEEHSLPSPLAPIDQEGVTERSRFFPLFRATSSGRITMQSHSPRMTRLLRTPEAFQQSACFIPVSVFWGRSMSSESGFLGLLTSEHWAMTGRLKRVVNLIINRRNIFLLLGRPVGLRELADGDESIAVRRTARLLRVRLRQQRVRTLGPDFSHRRTLINQVVQSRAVRRVVEHRVSMGEKAGKVERQAAKYARVIASDMSNPTVRVLARLLSWFWNRIYNGIELQGIERISQVSETHTLVYVPSHRSHLDYLLLSYLLYYQSHMIPHIAAGDNLDLPLVGGVLRRGGAFFMRRSFRGDALYAAVFDEYLYHVYRQGHCVEFFPEGGRTRTGRLLPAKFGLLKMTLEHQQRGLPKPLAFVPVYVSYEKLVEARSYLSELRGADKKTESLFDVFRNVRLVRENFGEVVVNIGEPIAMDLWLNEHADEDEKDLLAGLGREIMVSINAHAHLNPVNLVALITLATPKLAVEEASLLTQIALYQDLVPRLHPAGTVTVTSLSPAAVVERTEALKLLAREQYDYGTVLSHTPYAAVLMTWYRNNVAHALALPSLIACLLIRRRRGVTIDRLQRMTEIIYPSLAVELSTEWRIPQFERCIALLTEHGLVVRSDDQLTIPPPEAATHEQLELLANLVMPTLERMFIVVHQISRAPVTRDDLRTRSQTIAQKISRLYGINAPEFSDQRLFDQFIDFLLQRQAVTRDDDGLLHETEVISEVVRAAEHVIEPHIKHGVQLAVQNQDTR